AAGVAERISHQGPRACPNGPAAHHAFFRVIHRGATARERQRDQKSAALPARRRTLSGLRKILRLHTTPPPRSEAPCGQVVGEQLGRERSSMGTITQAADSRQACSERGGAPGLRGGGVGPGLLSPPRRSFVGAGTFGVEVKSSLFLSACRSASHEM